MKKLFLSTLAFITLGLQAQTIQVWDLGAEQLDAATYQNMLTVDEINSWFTEAPGSKGVTVSNITASEGINFKFVGAGKSNHRLRSDNKALTRYDEKTKKDADGVIYHGFIYSNAGSNTGVYVEQNYEVGDKIEFIVGSNGGAQTYVLESPSGTKQEGKFTAAAQAEKLTFYIAEPGAHKLYGTDEKLVVCRIYRTPALMVNVSGSITAPADIPADYQLRFTNTASHAQYDVTPAGATYNISLAANAEYEISLINANGYVVSEGKQFTLNNETLTHDLVIKAIDLCTISGNVTGLTAEELAKLELSFEIPADKIYQPEYTLNADATYSIQVEKGVEYTIHSLNVNDYALPFTTISADADKSLDLAFALKPQYAITIVPTGATVAELVAAQFTFTNLNEEGYVYTFTGTDNILLRDGVYSVKVSNTGIWTQLLTSNLKVAGANVNKTIDFTAEVSSWNFADADFTEGNYTSSAETYNYKTLQFTGAKRDKTYLAANNGAQILIPVKGASNITIKACYQYSLYIGEDSIATAKTGSTSQIDVFTYAYDGPAGVVTLETKGTTYLCAIEVTPVVAYKAEITVGAGKDYATLNEALAAIRSMTRKAGERVTVFIEPGNYEEMLKIDVNEVTFKNASATPSIALKDGGVNIDANAVRITGYYGHGYDYYSMGTNYMWDERTLQINKENGYASVVNGGGSSSTFWNATVIVSAKDFHAENIIFENSFNQYISKKESEDIVVEAAGSKGIRPTDVANTSVQERSFRERACALAFTKTADRAWLDNCCIVGRQDALYGDNGVRVAVNGGRLLGACDYLFGGMILVCKNTDLAMLVTSDGNDVAYITASKNNTGRGYLFWECNVVSAIPEVEMVETTSAKAGLWGRPWDAKGEAVFYKTEVGTTPAGKSLIQPAGWNDGLVAGGSPNSIEYGTIETSGEDNSAARVTWAKVLTEPTLPDGTEITLRNFTHGSDQWNPFNETDDTAIDNINIDDLNAQVMVNNQNLQITTLMPTQAFIYTIDGRQVVAQNIQDEANFQLASGIYVVLLQNEQGKKVLKLIL